MKNISKYKIDKSLLIPIILFAIISIFTLYGADSILPKHMDNLMIKQTLWYLGGFALIIFIMTIGNRSIYKSVWILYGVGIASLIGLFFFGTSINDAKCWYEIPGIGTIQPSEFMKIILIITNATLISKFNENFPSPSVKEELFFLIKITLVVLLPSILTFLQPDTGVVLIYLLITFIMLFISGIRYRWFAIVFGIAGILIALILGVYFISQDLFIKIYGTSFFLRVDRLLDWSNGSGYQLENSLSSIGSAGLFGHGWNTNPIYFPEAQTDFIFAVFATHFGFVGSVFLLALLTFFDIRLILLAMKTDKLINKYVIAGVTGMLIYQQFQNIGMTYGLLPITGITLPFISYGGSSLLSYMLAMGIIFNISNDDMRYTN
ncbi:MAG: FtsW/RodA/SpoVE family cell cycle protein [Bacilli bacterium]|nr:FtsW/RodA/SpoVE family cell cycle protein [Bacilli bacterium]